MQKRLTRYFIRRPELMLIITIIYDVVVLGLLAAFLITGHYYLALAVFIVSELLSLANITLGHRQRFMEFKKEDEEVCSNLNLIKSVLSESDDYIWKQLENGMLHWDDGMMEAMNWGSKNVTVDEFLDIFDDEHRNQISTLLNTTKPGVYAKQVMATIGERQWWEFRISVKAGPKASILRQGALISIEERVRQEAEMIRIHELMMNAQERSGFVRSMLHEIRTPLNGIIGFSQLISSEGIEFSDEEYDTLRRDVLNENDALVTLIENMLTLSHLNNGIVQFHITPTDVRSSVENAVDAMGEVFQRNGIKVDIDSQSPDVNIIADGKALTQILLRILDNSIKFSSPGSSVHISWKTEGNFACIYVSDEGIGIPENKQAIVFNRFSKLNPYSQGTGIGLAIAKEYCEKMKGSISLASKTGEGSTFCIKLKTASELL